jgi:TolB-like protein/DNA-binding winged helix-turn-helix (wHTH) protein/Flp pilus assembly protein TadD
LCNLFRVSGLEGCYNRPLQAVPARPRGGAVSVATGQEVVVRFAEFEIDLRSGELRINGTSVKLQPQPAKILALLVRRQGETVTRDEIVEEVWGSETFVDYEGGLNFAIRQIRTALGDDAEHPLYVETVPKRGYRFVAPLDGTAHSSVPNIAVPIPESPSGVFRGWRGRSFKVAGALLLAAMALLAIPKFRHWLRGRASKQPIQSIAVLPFANLSGDPTKDYFADGLTDELITDLAEQTKIRVVSRSSVVRYKGTQKPLPEIARELRVDAIVEGSVSLSDQQVRITGQLIEAASDRHLWAHSYERDRKDLFPIQSEVAATIASLIRANTETQSSAPAHPVPFHQRFTPETYELSLVCRNLRMTGTEEGVSQAIQCYQHILTLDPDCATAYAEQAHAYLELGLDNVPKARAAALKALELDPSLPEAHTALGEFKMFYERDLTGAEKELKQALALNPSYATAHLDYASVMVASGRMADAIAEAKTVRELDPFSARDATLSGMILFMAGQYDRAIEEEKASLDLYPQAERAVYWLGYAYEQKGMYKKAITEYEKKLNGDEHGVFLAALGRALSLSGDLKKANEVKRRIEHFSGKSFVWPYDAALFYAALGDKDLAFEWLERDQKERDGWLLFLNADPRLSSLHSDPRFHDLARRVGLPPSSAKGG